MAESLPIEQSLVFNPEILKRRNWTKPKIMFGSADHISFMRMSTCQLSFFNIWNYVLGAFEGNPNKLPCATKTSMLGLCNKHIRGSGAPSNVLPRVVWKGFAFVMPTTQLQPESRENSPGEAPKAAQTANEVSWKTSQKIPLTSG